MVQRAQGHSEVAQRAEGNGCDDARALAALRIVIATLLIVSPELHAAPALAARPELLEFVPEGARIFAALPLSVEVVRWLRWVALSSGATALLGFYSRSSMAVLTLAAMPLYSLSQQSGAVLHDMHLFWMSGLLSVSRCGDVWSLDAWGRRGLRQPPGVYRLAAGFARLFLGIIYFFPGLHKLLEAGFAWGTGRHLIAQMHAKWFQLGQLPAFRIDHYPTLCALGGATVPFFELAFIALVSWPRTRVLALLSGLAFHGMTQVFMFIPFVSLWACYVVLLPFGKLLGPARLAKKRAAKPQRLPVLLVGGAIATLAFIQGLRGQMQAWPFACYPTFQWIQGDTLPDLLIEAERDGSIQSFTGRERAPRSQAEWGRVFRLSGAYGGALDVSALRTHASDSAERIGSKLELGTRVRIFRAYYATSPERWGAPPVRRTLLTSYVVGTES